MIYKINVWVCIMSAKNQSKQQILIYFFKKKTYSDRTVSKFLFCYGLLFMYMNFMRKKYCNFE